MPYRMYVTLMADGYGDLGHLIDRGLFAETEVDKTIKEQYPAKFVLICKEHQEAIVKDKLAALPSDHPLHYNINDPSENPNLNIFVGSGLSLRNEMEKKLNHEFKDSIIYFVSTSPMMKYFNSYVDNIIINTGEHGHPLFNNDEQIIKTPFNTHLGFTKNDYGIFIKGTSRVDTRESFLSLPKILQMQILGLSQDEVKIMSDEELLKLFERILFIPAYVQTSDFLEQIAATITGSELGQGKEVVFFVTKNSDVKNLEDLSHTYNCRFVINNTYIDETTYKKIAELGEYIHVCSGDKSLEEAFEHEKIPFFLAKGTKRENYSGMINIIKDINDEENYNKGKIDLIQFLKLQIELARYNDPDDIKMATKVLTHDAYRFWKEVVVPYFKENFNYITKVAEIEKQSVMLYELLKLNDPSLINNHVQYFAMNLTTEELFNTLLVAVFYKNYINDEKSKAPFINFINKFLTHLTDKQLTQLVNYATNTDVREAAFNLRSEWKFLKEFIAETIEKRCFTERVEIPGGFARLFNTEETREVKNEMIVNSPKSERK